MPKRALIIEGGGMRGAHSAGVLARLAQHPELTSPRTGRPFFDIVCGSSAGSCTVAFWVAEQHQVYERIWGQYLHDDRFIRYRHMFTWRPVMDLDYLMHEVFVHHEPLDCDRIRNSSVDFFITATNCTSGEAHYFHNKQTVDILAALRAGAAMPLAYRLPVWLDGIPYADGGIAASIPVQKALDEGAEQLWVILTQPAGYRKQKVRLQWPRWLYRRYPALIASLRKRYECYNQQLELVDELERSGRAVVIRPTAPLPVSRLTREQVKLLAAIRQGASDAQAALTAYADFYPAR